MKKLPILLFIAIGLLFISCEKDSDPTSVAVAETAIVGAWQVTGYQVEDGQSITTAAGQSVTQNYTAVGKDYDMTLTFAEDPKTATSNGSYTIVLTTTVLGESFTQEQAADAVFESTAWDINGSDLMLITEDNEVQVQVTELTESKMVMILEIDEELALDADTNVVTSGTLTITLEK